MQTPSTPPRRPAPGARLTPAASLCGCMVLDATGDPVGSVRDLVLDLERGCVAYAVVASGGFLGVGERLVAVPWSALEGNGTQFVLQGGRTALDGGPAVEPDGWPVTPSPCWHESVHAHFRSRPYWKERSE